MIELKDIEFVYKKGNSLFKNLNVHLSAGHVYGLMGKNGAGKSTLLKHISGLLFPHKGTVSVLGYSAPERAPEMLEEIYVIPEDFELPEVSISVFASCNGAFYPKFNQQQFENYLQEFEIPIQNKISQMSYGQQKKFLISFGLATNVRILIMDEPSNGLDIPSKSQFRKIVASALDESRLIIISTHQVRDLENLIDAVLVLEKGQIIFNQDIRSISDKLTFEEDLSGIPDSEILYSELIQGKKSGIIPNKSGLETRVDLELLFNAIVTKNTLINQQF